MDIPRTAGQVHPLIVLVRCRPQSSGTGDLSCWLFPRLDDKARKRMQGRDSSELFEKALPDLPHVRFCEILIAIVLRVDRHQGIQLSLPYGVLRSIEGLLDLVNRLSIRVEVGPCVDPDCARGWSACSEDT